ncbi:sigma-70 family RNA polymerase sigma factor, partial [Mycobacteroides abscessus]
AMARDKSDPAENLPEQVDRHAGPEQEALNSESSRRMQALLEVLPEKQREILILRVVVGLSAEETADAVGSSAGAVRVAQHRALQKLKAEMTRAGDYRG